MLLQNKVGDQLSLLTIIMLAIAILVLLINYSLSWLSNSMENEKSDALVKVKPSTITTLSHEKPNISQYNLFGMNLMSSTTQNQAANLPASKLNVALVGTIASESTINGIAMIADEKGDQALYKTNDEVINGAIIQAIYHDRITILHHGKLETIVLEEVTTSSSIDHKQHNQLARQQVDQASWQDARKNVLKNTQQIAESVSALPVMEKGKMVGYRLRPNKDYQFLQQIGLRTTDILLAVNNIPLSDPSRFAEVTQLFKNEKNFIIQYKRNGKEQTLHVNL